MMVLLASLSIGALLVGAAWLAVGLFRQPVPDAAATIAWLTDENTTTSYRFSPVELDHSEDLYSRWGRRVQRVLPVRPSSRLTAQLRLHGRSLAHFYGASLVCALLAAAFGVCYALLATVIFNTGPLYSGGQVLALAVAGWFWPRFRISSVARHDITDANEALLVYLDLIVLERQANQHATDALTNAAQLSDAPIFKAIRGALERAELERVAPWPHLKRLGQELQLPALVDIADIAALQREGGSLTNALRARVAELRNSWVAQQQTAAARPGIMMQVWGTLPVTFACGIFLGAPLLSLVLGSR